MRQWGEKMLFLDPVYKNVVFVNLSVSGSGDKHLVVDLHGALSTVFVFH